MRIFMCILLFALNWEVNQAQNYGTPGCGTPETVNERAWSPEELNHCFDVQTVFDNCTKVWLKVNLHFFLDDQCEGSIDPLNQEDIAAEKAFDRAEDLINRANEALENNYEQWNQDTMWGIFNPKPQQCVPFRYALSGVYIHCNSEAQNTSGSFPQYFRDNFGVNTDSEYNGFLVEWIGPGSGHAISEPGNVFTTENFAVGIFNHEMGHLFNLRHSWNNDGFDDTPPIHFMYDFNCDGDFYDYWNGVGNEYWLTRQCWVHITEPTALDYDGDGIIDYEDLCNLPPECDPYPCCDWNYINNNIMCYSSYTECCAAFTEEQLIHTLETISTETYCPFVEDLSSSCPPPMANIGVLPFEETTDDCAFCFYLSASMHETHHIIEFFDENESLIHSTGWQEREAGKYCITKKLKNPSIYNNGFQAGQTYTLRLSIENYCGDEAIEEYRFTLPDLDCSYEEEPEYPIGLKSVAPNPFSNTITLDYEVLENGVLDISLVNVIDPSSQLSIITQQTINPGLYQQHVATHTLPPGIYALVINFKDQLVSITLVKN